MKAKKATDLSKGREKSNATTDETNGTSCLMDILPAVDILSGSAPFTDGKEQEENHESAEDGAGSPITLWLPNSYRHGQRVNCPNTKIPAEGSRVGQGKLEEHNSKTADT